MINHQNELIAPDARESDIQRDWLESLKTPEPPELLTPAEIFQLALKGI